VFPAFSQQMTPHSSDSCSQYSNSSPKLYTSAIHVQIASQK